MSASTPEKCWCWMVVGIVAWILATGFSPGLVVGQPIIQEVLYDGPGSDADDVFTEIFGAAGTSLDGWTLVGINGDSGSAYRTVELTGAIIPADGILVIATTDAAGDVLLQRDFAAAVDWQNGPDAVQLRDPEDHIVDALQYGDAGAFNDGEGTPAPMVSSGQSLERDALGTDTDDNLVDFTPQAAPTPGAGPAAANPSLAISLPDTTAVYGDSVVVPLRLADTSGQEIVAAEVFISYDGDLLTADSVSTISTLLPPDWTVVTHTTEGSAASIDTFKIAMASSGEVLAGAGALVHIHFDVAADRRPASTPLALEHVLFNAGTPGYLATHGGFTVVGTDGVLEALPAQIVPPAAIAVTVTDADEDQDPQVQDRFEVRVNEGAQVEFLEVVESGNSTGVFTGSIETALAAPIAGNGAIETGPGSAITFCYDDTLDAAGQTTERCATVQVSGGRDGRMEATVVCQPGDTLQVRVIDLDLNLDPEVLETANATALNSATGELETFTLTEISVDDSVFFGLVETASGGSNPGDGILAVHKADSIRVSYVDELPASGEAVEVADTSLVVDQFGDADGNGLVQAFDASRVLAHVLAPSLGELDSLAANVDSLAPFSAISPYDAALILQHRVGMRRRFPVQEPAALNHPQLEAGPAAPRPVAEERLLALRMHDGYVSVWASERSEVISGELVVEGITGKVELAAEMRHFLLASRFKEDGLHIVLAGAAPISGSGELLRVYPGAGFENAQLARAGFNSGRFVGRMEGTRASGAVASRFALYPNRPNPFNPETTIRFSVPRASAVRLEVFDVPGQRVRTLIAEELAAGVHHVVWDGRDERGVRAGSGVYFYRLQAGSYARMRPMVLLK